MCGIAGIMGFSFTPDEQVIKDHVVRRAIGQADPGDVRLDDGVVDDDVPAARVLAAQLVGQMDSGGAIGFAVVVDEVVLHNGVPNGDQAQALRAIIVHIIVFNDGLRN